MKTHPVNKKQSSSGKLNKRGFSPVPVLLLAVLLTGLALVSGACAGTTLPAASDATTSDMSGTTMPTTETSTTTASAATTTESAGTTKSPDIEEPASVQLIGADEALQILKDNPDAILLDVRTEQEFVSGHIAGAVLIPVDEISARLAELPEDKSTPIIVYCRSGNRSATAARMLINAGYRTVYDLGGINSWPYEIVR
jgi:rhodanese-related sulfurtransferase